MDAEKARDEMADNNPAGVPPASAEMPIRTGESSEATQGTERDERTGGASSQDGAKPQLVTSEDDAFVPKSKHEVGWRRLVRNFSPSWFSVTMGTGVVSLLLYSMPYNGDWLYWLSVVFFCLNTALFFLALAISVVRYSLYPEIWGVMIMDPNSSLFISTVPIGFATLVEMWTFVCVPAFGPWAITFAWAIWIVDAVVAVAVTCSLSVLLIMQNHQLKSLDRFTAAQLLPIAATVVAAGVGAEVAAVLPDPQRALGSIIACYVLWGMATPLAMAVLVMYYQRLAVYKMPPREVIVSCFLPLGPLGFGGYTIMYLGKVAAAVLPATGTLHPLAGPVMYVVGFFLALVMWGFGLVWFAIALVSLYQASPFPFNMGWWGFTFPLGVFTSSTIQLGLEMPSRFFRVLGEVFAVAVILLWCLVAARTAHGAWTGKLFFAPCLANLKKDETEGKPKA